MFSYDQYRVLRLEQWLSLFWNLFLTWRKYLTSPRNNRNKFYKDTIRLIYIFHTDTLIVFHTDSLIFFHTNCQTVFNTRSLIAFHTNCVIVFHTDSLIVSYTDSLMIFYTESNCHWNWQSSLIQMAFFSSIKFTHKLSSHTHFQWLIQASFHKMNSSYEQSLLLAVSKRFSIQTVSSLV